MKTTHQIYYTDSIDLSQIPSGTVDLVVTSPPYPMIEMWDKDFSSQNPEIEKALEKGEGKNAFEEMHRYLDSTWAEVKRLLKEGGICCINIGDAVRTIGGTFQLYPNHARIIEAFQNLGFEMIPSILWRKPTNSPNKFMGSGMLPAGAYVTLEHEHILIFRKDRRIFAKEEEKNLRRRSAFFWEERNNWFSDIWFDLTGTAQNLKDKKLRQRSAAFPQALPYRLVQMFSVQGDTVLDPFLGTGTTTVAAVISGRNSIGVEVERSFGELIEKQIQGAPEIARKVLGQRLGNHISFVEKRAQEKGPLKHTNQIYGFPVVTAQEKDLFFPELMGVEKTGENFWEGEYSLEPSLELTLKM